MDVASARAPTFLDQKKAAAGTAFSEVVFAEQRQDNLPRGDSKKRHQPEKILSQKVNRLGK